MSDLDIVVEKLDSPEDSVVVTLDGTIEPKTFTLFRKKVTSVLDEGAKRIVIDMENVRYVNSTGLGFFVNLSDLLAAKSGSLVFSSVQPKVKAVFDVLGLNTFFRIATSRDEAVRVVSEGAPPRMVASARPPAPQAVAPQVASHLPAPPPLVGPADRPMAPVPSPSGFAGAARIEPRQSVSLEETAGSAKAAPGGEEDKGKAKILLGQVRAWKLSGEIREFVRAAKRASAPIKPGGAVDRWLKWALDYAAAIDPLSAIRGSIAGQEKTSR